MDSVNKYSLDDVLQTLSKFSYDESIPEEIRKWAKDGIIYAENNHANIYDFPANIFNYVRGNNPMPEKVRDLVEGILEQEIQAGNDLAANDLGALYYDGRIGEQSYEKAFEYYTLASNLGNTVASENLGYIYYYGKLGEVDYEKAFMCFVKGALRGQIISIYKLGDMYKNGYFVKKDEYQARMIYSHCVDLITGTKEEEYDRLDKLVGPDVYVRYADCWLNGIGCDIDIENAYYWATRAQLKFFRRVKRGESFAKEGLDWSSAIVFKCQKELESNLLNS